MKLEDETLHLFVLPVSFSFLLFLSLCLSVCLSLSLSLPLSGSVVISAVTSCTNTSNPSIMLEAGLLAKNAVEIRVNGGTLHQDQLVSRQWGGHILPQGERGHTLPQTIRVSSFFLPPSFDSTISKSW